MRGTSVHVALFKLFALLMSVKNVVYKNKLNCQKVRIYTKVSLLGRRIFEVTLSDEHKNLVKRTPIFSKGFIPLIARIADCRDGIVCDCSLSGLGRA